MPDIVFAAFSLLWFATALLERNSHYSLYARTVLLVGSFLLTGTACLVRDACNLTGSLEKERAERMVYAIAIIQSVSLGTATAILLLLGLPNYVPTAIAMIVSLHLLPMARGRHGCDKITSGLLLVWCLGWIAFARHVYINMAAEVGAGCVMLAGVSLRRLGCSTADAVSGTLPGS